MKSNKELKKILNNNISELDMVKAMISYHHQQGYTSVTINDVLTDEAIKELELIGFKVNTIVDYYNGDYTKISW